MLIIQRQIEVIQHNSKPEATITKERRSLDEIASLTIQMHLAENVYINMEKEMTTFALWEKLQVVCEKKSCSSRFILI